MLLTSQQEFAIWQPAWPTKNHQSCQYKVSVEPSKIDMGRAVYGASGKTLPLMLMTSLMVTMVCSALLVLMSNIEI
jgi:hypothetical protein